ncbi:protein stum [Drosophila busckii]|uniref:protein stum n=1 Tax=Drosophila busckii TaxID=30019 RepID=UPI00083EF1E8|nr:protein stum [Drosophila busckii]
MQQTLSYSSTPSPTRPLATISQSIQTPDPATPAIISVDFSYANNPAMSPSAQGSSSARLNSQQSTHAYSSLFGDPVPPPQPEDYFGTAAFESIRAGSFELQSSEEDTLVAAVALDTLIAPPAARRLFSNVPYASLSSMPRLQPPDIQILPNSSGGSSSEQLNSPNFQLLTPQHIVNNPEVYECDFEQQTTDNYAEIFEPTPEPTMCNRPLSASYSSTTLDWYRPTSQHFAEFSRIPKLRPSSKSIMCMKNDEMQFSPLATMLQDSNGSSSGDEKQLTGNALPTPTSTMDRNLILSPQQFMQQQSNELQAYRRDRSASLISDITTKTELTQLQSQTPSMSGQMSPVVFKDSISTGGDYRVGETRLHKKSSFTILSVRSPKPSPQATPRRSRPVAARHSIQSTTTSSLGAAAAAPVRPARRKSLARLPQLLPLPQIPNDDSPRPSVQFNMSAGGYSPSKLAMPTKGILQQRDSLTSSVDTYTPRAHRRSSIGNSPFGQRIKSLETLPLITDAHRSSIPRFHRSNMELHKELSVIPPGTVPRSLKPNPNPTRAQRGLLGVVNKQQESPPQLPAARSNWLSLDDLAVSKPTLEPIRLQARRRSSSTSPERRSSTQTASDRRSSNLSSITTSDFSFRRPTLSTLPATTTRRKSVYAPPQQSPRRQSIVSKEHNRRAKIAKPSSLSPIIGTPNKDASQPQSPLHGAAYEAAHNDSASEFSLRRDSISRIPVRRRNSRGSHSNSPLKDFMQTPSGRNSRASNSRSPSGQINMLDARLTPTRFYGSRPTSRDPPSRPSSRLTQARDSVANSRANSRLSVRSSLRSTSISPAAMSRSSRGNSTTTPNRRKSVSVSPQPMLGRRMSISPVKLGKKSPKTAPAVKSNSSADASKRRNSRSRIPTSTNGSMRKLSTPSKKAALTTPAKTAEKPKTPRAVKGKIPTTAKPKEKSLKTESAKKKTTTVSSKAETSVKRTGSKVLTKPTPKKPAAKQKSPQMAKKTPAKTQATDNGKSKAQTKTNGNSGLPRPLTRTASNQSNKKVADSAANTAKANAANTASAATNATSATPKAKHKATPEHENKVKTPAADTATDINPLAVQVGNAVLQAAEALPAVRNEVGSNTSIKRQGSNMGTLVRMSSRLSLMSNKKRVDSAQQRKVATVHETTTEASKPKDLSDGTEAQKTLHEVAEPKTHEAEAKAEHGASPTPSGVTKPDSSSRLDTADGGNALNNAAEAQKSPLPPTQPIEASISVVNAANGSSTPTTKVNAHSITAMPEIDNERPNTQEDSTAELEQVTSTPGRDDFQVDDKRLSPDGQGSTAGSGGVTKTSSQEFLKDDVTKKGFCSCCSTLCMRFRRSHCFRCCGLRKERHGTALEEQPVLSSARSSASTAAHVEIVDERQAQKKKSRCWPASNCCSCLRKKSTVADTVPSESKMSAASMTPLQANRSKPQGKCGMCLSKIFCCRSVNRVDPITGNETELSKCCFCIPCRRKKAAASEPRVAWRDADAELGISATDAAIVEGSSLAPSTAVAAAEAAPKVGCCKRFWLMMLCCRKQPRRASNARRQSIAPPPASEETRRKLHNDLVEYNSKMKGAIPVLPLYLAWFCAFCNVVFPGLGTLLSGLFCLCVGIPRFSQFDSARARIGSFIINIIVAVAQFFCVLFCFVGWGWSIWWGTIMLKCAKKLSKIKKVERLELEEEQRQAELAAAAVPRAETEAAKT